jgi:hypothetical protein
MGYTFNWKEIEDLCRMLGLKRKYKTSTYSGIGPDGKYRRVTIHAKHPGNIALNTLNKIAKEQLLFSSVKEMYEFYQRNK